ncbi:hypothetical protein EHS25_006522 [Saitozyma podzolica]|uniref:AAA+ ATPase domain-containing protein n=1 Tax=Saitozyma podzolica TaxID=1890683 RepID=A0A427YS31_9TREE|nr:hypothetical protein EHS25_006522 [Saitozyma podzolica]
MSEVPVWVVTSRFTSRCLQWLNSGLALAENANSETFGPIHLLSAWIKAETWANTFPDGFGDLVSTCDGDVVKFRLACDARINALSGRTDPQEAIVVDFDLREVLEEAHTAYLKDKCLFIDCWDLIKPMSDLAVFRGVFNVSRVNMESLRKAVLASHTENNQEYPCILPGGGHKQGKILVELNIPCIGKVAEAGTWNRTIGYKDEIDTAVGHLLARRSVVFTGIAGVGKSLCIRELIRQATLGGRPGLNQAKFWELDLASLISNTKYPSQDATQVTNLIAELAMLKEEGVNAIVIWDDLHSLFTYKPSSSNHTDIITEMFKTAIGDGTITLLGAMTSEEYMRYIMPNKAMDCRISEVVLHEPSIPRTLTMLRETIYSEWNDAYGVVMTDHSLCRVVEHATAFMRSARPSSAAGLAREVYKVASKRAGGDRFAEERLLDELEHVRIDMRSITDPNNLDDPQLRITIDDVNEALENITGLRLRDPTPGEYELVKTIRATLGSVVSGQEPALQTMERCFGRRILHRRRQRPIGALLFTGPPGTGKSALGEALAIHGFGGKNHLLLIDPASFKGPSVRVDLLGGRNTSGRLSEFVTTAKTGVIMVNEVEKGDHHLLNLFLDILEHGSVLVRETGMELSLTPFFFIFTSNLGDKYIRRPTPESTVPATDEDKVLRKIRSQFRPRFLECIDRIIIDEHIMT